MAETIPGLPPPFPQQASELILEGNVNEFSANLDICFMCRLKNSKKNFIASQTAPSIRQQTMGGMLSVTESAKDSESTVVRANVTSTCGLL